MRLMKLTRNALAAGILIAAGLGGRALAEDETPRGSANRPLAVTPAQLEVLTGSSRHPGAMPRASGGTRLAGITGSRTPLTRTALEQRIEAAGDHPLGSELNPVRVFGTNGQRAYLRQLRCEDGSRPDVLERIRNGAGVYGTVVHVYALQCADAQPVLMWMDMHHYRDRETEAAAGFQLASAR
jgi:hypothetical protein